MLDQNVLICGIGSIGIGYEDTTWEIHRDCRLWTGGSTLITTVQSGEWAVDAGKRGDHDWEAGLRNQSLGARAKFIQHHVGTHNVSYIHKAVRSDCDTPKIPRTY